MKQASKKKIWRLRFVLILGLCLGTIFCGYQTLMVWTQRPHQAHSSQEPPWTINTTETPVHDPQTFLRLINDSHWIPLVQNQIATRAYIATKNSSATLINPNDKSQISLSAQTLIFFDPEKGVTLLKGMIHTTSITNSPNPKTVFYIDEFGNLTKTPFLSLTTSDEAQGFPYVANLGQTTQISIDTRKIASKKTDSEKQQHALILEFSKNPDFQPVLYTKQIEHSNHPTSISIGERSTGYWYARLRDNDSNTLAATSFYTYFSPSPNTTRYGLRWIAWARTGVVSKYRLETSESSDFKKILTTHYTASRLFDLSQMNYTGSLYLRLTGILTNNEEQPVLSTLALNIAPKDELLRARAEIGNPRLQLMAHGWRIELNEDESQRIREGYVILRESELRGIRVAKSLKDKVRVDPTRFVFEVAREPSFSNPERVHPTSRGELLPPALPLGTIFTRLREIDATGQFGEYGPTSKITTYLSSPNKLAIKKQNSKVLLSWNLPTNVEGFNVRLSTNRQFLEAETVTYQTSSNHKTIHLKKDGQYYWTVTALDKNGAPISKTSRPHTFSYQAHKPLHKIITETKQRTLSKKEIRRSIASINPSLIELVSPEEDAVIVGGASATKYGYLRWTNVDPFAPKKISYLIQIATDRDFVNIIERGSSKTLSYQLQGDLPEGSLFWRVRDKSQKSWSAPRRLDLVYE